MTTLQDADFAVVDTETTGRCRGEARLAIAKDGTLAIYALDGEAHRCGG